MRRLTVIALLTASCAPSLCASIWTVGMGGGAQFREIQDAVAAAQSGDTILVGPGTYRPFAIEGKVLLVLGAGSGLVEVGLAQNPSGSALTSILVRDQPAGSETIVAGMSVRYERSSGPPPYFADDIVVSRCAGAVTFSDIAINWSHLSAEEAAFRIDDCSEVRLLGCDIEQYGPREIISATRSRLFVHGGRVEMPGVPFCRAWPDGGVAIGLEDSFARLSDVLLRGEQGMIGFSACSPPGPGRGGAGVVCRASHLEVWGGSACQILGANGGCEASGANCADGGAGIDLRDGSTALVHFLATVTGGNGGSGPAPAVSVDSTSSWQSSTVRSPLFRADSATATGGVLDLALEGWPFSTYFAFLSVSGMPPREFPGLRGELRIDPLRSFVLASGLVPGAGRVAWSIPVPAGPEFVGLVVWAQSLQVHPSQGSFSNLAITYVR